MDAHLLRDQRGEVVVSVLEGEDTFCILPTEFGRVEFTSLPLCHVSITDASTSVSGSTWSSFAKLQGVVAAL